MKIWYVVDSVYNDDDLISIDEVTFYSTEEKAEVALQEEEAKRKLSCDINNERYHEKWEINELAVAAMEKAGIDWRSSGLSHHKRDWKPIPYTPIYEIRSLEIE